MKTYELVVPCHFGLEAVLKREIYDLGYEISRVEDGRVSFQGDAEAVCRANIFLRTAERVLIEVGRFRATTFEELFQGIKALPWEDYIPVNGKFWVKKASSIKSKLFSPSDIQSIAKKAMVERMKQHYDVEWFAEDGAPYPVRIFLLKDEVMVTLDTSGDSLHKRGYRTLTSKAPLTETLAASLLLLTPWRPDLIDRKLWYECVKEAEEMIHTDVKVDIQGYDIDGDVIKAARENAKRAGVDHLIHFQQRPVAELHHPKKYGFIVTNPPYGERLEDKADLPKLYGEIGAAFRGLDSWSMYLITSYDEAERYIGRKADKNRKIYNGMLRTYFYQFMGPKPPRRSVRDTAGGDE